MNRRDLFKGAAALAASALILPERKVWALDRTMLLPPQSQGGMIWWAEQVGDRYINHAQHITVHDLESLIRSKWVLIHRGLGETGGPYEEVSGYRPDVPGSGFMVRYDVAGTTSPDYAHALEKDVSRAILDQEYLIDSMGLAGRPEQVLPGFGYTAPYNAPLKDADETTEPVWDEWWR